MVEINSTVKYDVYLQPPPIGLEQEFGSLLTQDAVKFLIDLNIHFQKNVDELYDARVERKCMLKKSRELPKFKKILDDEWTVASVNHRLQNRHLDLGDVSPSDYSRFTSALKANVQGIQVDFDDGHCPTWKNQISGLYNIYRAIHNDIPNVPMISDAPLLIFRPRAWNMMEHNMSINGVEVPGPLFDFGLLMFHAASILSRCESGPFFYLSKLEGSSEAKLWNEIFSWSEKKLGIAFGTVKACVLIEDILSSFEMDQILYELKDHSMGLNCGIWDYAASIISKFGDKSSFLIPDRKKYVDMTKPFLRKYMDLVVKTCHKRNAHATGGMAAQLLPPKQAHDYDKITQIVVQSKLAEIKAGVDGFMVYDLALIELMHNLWRNLGPIPNQMSFFGTLEKITETDLLTLPSGGVTVEGLKHNISVALLFIFSWLCGKGVFAHKGAIEDSATAEISKAQIWQWIRLNAKIEDTDSRVTRNLVFKEASNIYKHLLLDYGVDNLAKKKLAVAFDIFLEIVNSRSSPQFLTTYLNDAHIFRKFQSSL